MNTEEDMEKRYVAALEKQLQEEKMVTFKLSQQIERKDAALRSALEWLDEDEAPQLERQIKESLK